MTGARMSSRLRNAAKNDLVVVIEQDCDHQLIEMPAKLPEQLDRSRPIERNGIGWIPAKRAVGEGRDLANGCRQEITCWKQDFRRCYSAAVRNSLRFRRG
jgi:hypothetical protein